MMNRALIVSLCSLLAIDLGLSGAFAKDGKGRYSDYRFVDIRQVPSNSGEIGGSMFQAAAANTVVLGWWQFDNPGGTPNKQGWTEWDATIPPGFGEFGELYRGGTVVQEDACQKVLSNLWGWFDSPTITNYACGGWPGQGAIRYGPDANGLYLNNEIWSPWRAVTPGMGNQFRLEFLAYWDMPLDALVFLVWHVRTRDNDSPDNSLTSWADHGEVYSGGNGMWWRSVFEVGSFVRPQDDEIQIAIGAVDLCPMWCGILGSGSCHSHAPLIDQVKLVRVETWGPQFLVKHWDLWQDNFPELGGIGPTREDPEAPRAYARCDMAQDMIPRNMPNIVPGDSLVIRVADPLGLATDNTGGRPGKAVYVFVRCTDRADSLKSYEGPQMQSPDNRAWADDPNAGLLRWPLVTPPPISLPVGWYAYRMDSTWTAVGGKVKDTYCVDLMDLAAGPYAPYHPNENSAANTGIFQPGDVIHYFFGAKNTGTNWRFWHRTQNGQGADRVTGVDFQARQSPCEWSVLPDAGRKPGDLGDILFVDDTEGGWEQQFSAGGCPAQTYFDDAFKYLGIENRVDRYDVLAAGSFVGNSLASRVKSTYYQMVGDPVEIYQKVLWNSGEYNGMGDGGTPNGGRSVEKSDDFGVCYNFLMMHPDNPGWAYWGDGVVNEWSYLTGVGAVMVKSAFMQHTFTAGDQAKTTGWISPLVHPTSPPPPVGYLQPTESFYVNGGCPFINAFDVPGRSGLSQVAHRYNNASNGPVASLSQVTPNAMDSTARFFLAGFGFNVIVDDDTDGVPDRAEHLWEILSWFANVIPSPVGIDPVAFENRLDDNYPNPFNPTTTIKYSIAERGHVSLRIYNAAGQLVRTLVEEEQASRVDGFSIAWDGTNNIGGAAASGVYFYKLTAKNFSQTKKMVLLR